MPNLFRYKVQYLSGHKYHPFYSLSRQVRRYLRMGVGQLHRFELTEADGHHLIAAVPTVDLEDQLHLGRRQPRRIERGPRCALDGR